MNKTYVSNLKRPGKREPSAGNPYTYGAAVTIVVLVLCWLAEYFVVGQVLIGLYAMFAFWRLTSTQVFRLAMVALAVMLVAILIERWPIVTAFAAYALLLFMVGVFVLSRELWRFSKQLRGQQQKEDNAQV